MPRYFYFFLQIEFGIVYSCVEDKMYTARKGKGAFRNGQKLQVSGQKGKLVAHSFVLQRAWFWPWVVWL